MDAPRSLPTPEMSPENMNEKEHYLHLYGHHNNRFSQQQQQHQINVQQTTNLNNSNSNSQTGSTQLYQMINNQARHSPGTPGSTSSTNNSTTNNSVYSVSGNETTINLSTSQQQRSTNDNPVTELISKFSPNSSSFLKNVCPPFQRSTPQQSPTPPNGTFDQQQSQLTIHTRQAGYCQPIIDQNQMYSAKRTAYSAAYANVENGQLTWPVYEQQNQPQQYLIKTNEYGNDQMLINNNDLYANYYNEQQQYAAEQMLNQNDYLNTNHLIQAQQNQSLHQHQLNNVQSQQIQMMQQYGREDSSFINVLTEAQETISS